MDALPSSKIEYYDNGPLLVSAAQHGLGIALVLEDMVNFKSGTSGLVRPFGESAETPYSYFLAVKNASGSRRAIRWFSQWLLNEVASDPRNLMQSSEFA